ncbi:DUF2840 domain-containing protein [Acetobacter okinawensis]|uniref:DUF2840 domain-containing protein n=1 Tax=Acetobacter okinawensis TaxID=1076594 RepID=UPI001BAA8A78|nr:DUF2840 domain-containing protein [Acetobacter okinawensis]MBS0989435.1 DUF2840 domain-containing protein [Acetobacter okinawensis]
MTAPSFRPDDAALTTVELTWIEKRIEHWVRFGHPVEDRILDRRRRLMSFTPDSVFAFIRWATNDFGTVVSCIDIVRAVGASETCQTVPFVRPGGESLLRQTGWPKVRRVLEAIDGVEALGIDPATACPDHWRHLHHRLAAAQEPRPYTRERHAAWLRRGAVS